MYEIINGTPMPVREYNGQRVVTFRDIDSVHQRPNGTARKRFNDNRKHFIESVDFYKITPSEFRTAIGAMDERQQNDITLITLSGYLMISKSFTDELSWSVQRLLVTYFTSTEQADYSSLFHRQNELENRLNQLESRLSGNTFRLPMKSSPQTIHENAVYIMEKLYKSEENIFTKQRVLILCRPLKAKPITEALKLLAEHGYISYQKVYRARGGNPKEVIETLKTK